MQNQLHSEHYTVANILEFDPLRFDQLLNQHEVAFRRWQESGEHIIPHPLFTMWQGAAADKALLEFQKQAKRWEQVTNFHRQLVRGMQFDLEEMSALKNQLVNLRAEALQDKIQITLDNRVVPLQVSPTAGSADLGSDLANKCKTYLTELTSLLAKFAHLDRESTARIQQAIALLPGKVEGKAPATQHPARGRQAAPRLKHISPEVYPNHMPAARVTHTTNFLDPISHNFPRVRRMVNPPGYPPTNDIRLRDYNWFRYLDGFNANGSRRPSNVPPAGYPDPSMVGNKRLQAIGALGQQQGVQYAWGGGHGPKPGPTQGTKGDGDGSKDFTVVGMDCSGFARLGVYEATGYDIGAGGTTTQLANLRAHGGKVLSSGASNVLSPVEAARLKPGTLLYYGENGSQHVAMYVGNGQTIETNHSGYAAHFGEAAGVPVTKDGVPVYTHGKITAVDPRY